MSGSTELGRRAPAERHAAVLDAAESLFLARGVDPTSIDAIAKRAGVAKGTVYLYFPSKEHIARELEARFNARIVERTHLAAAAAASGPSAVQEWCAALVDAYLDEVAVHDMLFYGRGSASREGTADNVLVDDLATLLATHDFGEPDAVAAFLVGGVTLLVDRALLATRIPDRARLAATARSLARSTIGGGPLGQAGANHPVDPSMATCRDVPEMVADPRTRLPW